MQEVLCRQFVLGGYNRILKKNVHFQMFSFAVEEKSCYLQNPIQIFAVVKSSKTIFSIKFQLRFVPDARWSGVSARRGHTSTEHFLRPSIIDLTDRYFVYLNKFGFLCENTSRFKKESNETLTAS